VKEAEVIEAICRGKLRSKDSSFTIDFNPHKSSYISTEDAIRKDEWIMNMAEMFADEESRQRAIDTDSVWIAQWYPDTPIGFYHIAAPTLAELMQRVAEFEG
jgi:hypothetical protein